MQRKTTGSPLWSTVLADLRTRMDAGEFAERFPSDRELMIHYKVSRHTVREAVRRLDAVDRRPRVGGRVRSPQSVLHQLATTLTALGVRTSMARHPPRRRRNGEIAARLGRSPGTPLLFETATLYADGAPLIITEVWFAARDSIDEEVTTALLSAAALDPSRIQAIEHRTVPAVPETTICKELGLPAGTATFCFEEALEIDGGRYEVRQRSYVRADRYPCIVRFATR